MRKDIRVRPGKAQSIMGLIGSFILVCIGIFIVIPSAGLFGIFWTLLALISFISCIINLFSKKGITSSHIEIQQDDTMNEASIETRLREAQALYDKGLINKCEFEETRKEILKSL